MQDLTKDLAEQFGYQDRVGVIVSEVLPDSPAEQSGLKTGQLIEEVNKVRISSVADLQQVLSQSAEQDRVLLKVRSGNYSQYVVLRSN